MEYCLIFPFSALRFDFDHTGAGVAEITDRYGDKARLRVAVTYPFTHDPTPANLTITGAWLLKNKNRYPIGGRHIRIEGKK